MRAQVREAAGGYPYLPGESDPITLRVVPGAVKHKSHRRRCPRGGASEQSKSGSPARRAKPKHLSEDRHLTRRKGKLRCAAKPGRHRPEHTGRRGGRR
jgi:hypothetical protein